VIGNEYRGQRIVAQNAGWFGTALPTVAKDE